jgi:hypothetical protein
MKRRLRIAVSVFFALVAVAFAVLWVRSYWRCDDVSWGISGGPGYKFISLRGEVSGSWFRSREGAVSVGWRHATVAPDRLPQLSSSGHSQLLGFSFWMPYLAVVPHWFVVVLSVSIATAPWLSYSGHFSLRTLLIATTLIAIVLGLAVWAGR